MPPDTVTTYEIPFTEYVRPNGRRRQLQWLTTSRELHAKAQAIIASGFVFEIERLGGDAVSATITHSEAGDMAHCLAHNDKRLTEAITKMIDQFDIIRQTQRVKETLEHDDE